MNGKHIYKFLGIGVSAVILCAGCASEETPSNPAEVQIREETLESKIDAADVPEHTSEPDGGFAAGTAVELTIEELNQFTEFVNQAENNGFLLSQYDTVSEADLNEILYNGAGLGAQPLSESERNAYEAAGFTIETDITRLTVAQIEDFLQRKAGVGMEDMAGGLPFRKRGNTV